MSLEKIIDQDLQIWADLVESFESVELASNRNKILLQTSEIAAVLANCFGQKSQRKKNRNAFKVAGFEFVHNSFNVLLLKMMHKSIQLLTIFD